MYSLNNWTIFRFFDLSVWCKLLAGSYFLFFPLPLGDTNTKGTLDSFLLGGGQCHHSCSFSLMEVTLADIWCLGRWQSEHCCRIYGSVNPRVCTHPYVRVLAHGSCGIFKHSAGHTWRKPQQSQGHPLLFFAARFLGSASSQCRSGMDGDSSLSNLIVPYHRAPCQHKVSQCS